MFILRWNAEKRSFTARIRAINKGPIQKRKGSAAAGVKRQGKTANKRTGMNLLHTGSFIC